MSVLESEMGLGYCKKHLDAAVVHAKSEKEDK